MEKITLVIGLFFLLAQGVLGVGVQVPEGLEGTTTFSVGEEKTMMFTVKGDAAVSNVKFFVDVMAGGGSLRVEGLQQYQRTLSLSAFESRQVTVEFEGVKEHTGVFEVKYGFMYVDATAGAMGMQQVVQSTFDARVRCVGACGGSSGSSSSGSSSSSSSSGSRGGGGGGGAYIPPVNATKDVAKVSGVASSVSQEEKDDVVVVVDVGGDSEIAEGRVPVQERSLPQTLGFDAASVSDGRVVGVDRMVVVVLFCFAALSAVLTGVVRKAIKSEGDGV